MNLTSEEYWTIQSALISMKERAERSLLPAAEKQRTVTRIHALQDKLNEWWQSRAEDDASRT